MGVWYRLFALYIYWYTGHASFTYFSFSIGFIVTLWGKRDPLEVSMKHSWSVSHDHQVFRVETVSMSFIISMYPDIPLLVLASPGRR